MQRPPSGNRPAAFPVILSLAALAAATAIPAASACAEVAPREPYAQLAGEVMDFILAEPGAGGIRTNDNDPQGYPVPPYFYHYAIYDNNALWSDTTGYPFHAAVSFPAYTLSVAIDAFLDWWRFSGDPQAVTKARACADWLLDHLTPATDLYGSMPYSVQTDGAMGGEWDGDAIMPDKAAMFGVRLLRLHDTTGEPRYLDAAVAIGNSLVAAQLAGDAGQDGRWPFRVRPADGVVRQDYTSHLQPALRLLAGLAARTGDFRYATAAARAWGWLLANPANPQSPSWQRWEGFYEDQPPEMQTGQRDHYSAHEMIAELIARRPAGWEELAAAILDTAAGRYLVAGADQGLGPYVPATLEWSGWREATYAATLQYACSALRLWQALEGSPRRDDAWRDQAYGMAAACSWGQNGRGVAADGRMFTTLKDITRRFYFASWYEQNFNTVKSYLELMALDPLLAPAGEHHMLASTRAITAIAYPPASPTIRWQTAGGAGRELLRVAAAPVAVRAGGAALPALPAPPAPDADPVTDPAAQGWHHDAVTGVLVVAHAASPVEVLFAPTAVGPEARPAGPRLTSAGRAGGALLTLPAASGVVATVHDLRGRRVATLLDGAWLAAGEHELVWDGRDARARRAASGTYLLRVSTPAGAAATRLTVAR